MNWKAIWGSEQYSLCSNLDHGHSALKHCVARTTAKLQCECQTHIEQLPPWWLWLQPVPWPWGFSVKHQHPSQNWLSKRLSSAWDPCFTWWRMGEIWTLQFPWKDMDFTSYSKDTEWHSISQNHPWVPGKGD